MSINRGCIYEKDFTSSSSPSRPLLADENLKSYCSSLQIYEDAKNSFGDKVIHPKMKGNYRKFKLPPDCACRRPAAGGKNKSRKAKKTKKTKKTKRKQTKKAKKTKAKKTKGKK